MQISREGRWLEPRSPAVSGDLPRRTRAPRRSQPRGRQRPGAQFDPLACLENEPLARGLDEQALRRIAPDLPRSRRRLIARVRSAVRRGTYVTDHRVREALRALLADDDL